MLNTLKEIVSIFYWERTIYKIDKELHFYLMFKHKNGMLYNFLYDIHKKWICEFRIVSVDYYRRYKITFNELNKYCKKNFNTYIIKYDIQRKTNLTS